MHKAYKNKRRAEIQIVLFELKAKTSKTTDKPNWDELLSNETNPIKQTSQKSKWNVKARRGIKNISKYSIFPLQIEFTTGSFCEKK